MSAFEKCEAARRAVKEAEDKGMSARTQQKRWKALFAAEDALKLEVGGWR